MQIQTIGILGGSGFVGTHLACHLSRTADIRLRILTRRRERAKHLLVLPNLELVQTDVDDQAALTSQLAATDAVINLVGILNEPRDDGRGFHKAHVALTENLIAACEANGSKRLLQMSALRAAPDAPSHYLRSKAQAEEALRQAAGRGLEITVFRPSVIFGPEDDFLNRFAMLLRLSPLVFPLACAHARFSPVYVGDVAEAFARCLNEPSSFGQSYDLCGPKTYELGEILAYAARLLALNRTVVPLPDALARLQARILELLPGKPFSRDNYRSLQLDSICTGSNGLRTLGISPTPMEAVVPGYLCGPHRGGRYGSIRAQARRSGH